MNTTAKIKLLETISFIEGAYAPATIRAYKSNFEQFIDYCNLEQQDALPAESKNVASYIKKLSNGKLKSSSIRIAVAAISTIHRLNNLTDPTQHPIVKIEMRRMHRQLGREAKQAFGITRPILNQMIAQTDNSPRGVRDRALISVAYDTLCRRSEIVNLRVEDIESYNDKLRIRLRKSKTDPYGNGRLLILNPLSEKYLLDWLVLLNAYEGFIFRSIRGAKIQDQISAAQINRIYKYLAKKVGLEKNIYMKISGHSMRVGGAQDLLASGYSLGVIMTKGRWSKTDTVARYLEHTDLTN